MKASLRCIALGLALLAPATARPADCGGALGLSSENLRFGISLSEGRPSAFADAHCRFAQNWDVGIGAASVRSPAGRATTQVSFYLDRHWPLGEDWSFQLGVSHYEPAAVELRPAYRYDEARAYLAWRGQWMLGLNASPRVGNAYLGAGVGYNGWWRAESSWRQPFADRYSLDAGLGLAHATGTPPLDYRYANLTLNANFGDAYLSLTRVWTSARRLRYDFTEPPFEFRFAPDQRWVGSVMWMF